MPVPRLLIVDPSPEARTAYLEALAPLCGAVLRFETDPAAIPSRLAGEPCDLLILALARGDDAELDLLRTVRAAEAALPVVVVAPQSLHVATACLKLGHADYLAQPWRADELRASIERLLAGRRIDEQNAVLRRQVERPYQFDDMLGVSAPMRKVFEIIEQVADSDVDVLVNGETGTGKELVARSIHSRSRRADGPFVPVDCGAIPENLLESEFFGHERGAFTGADQRRIGLLEFADGGTFFLDEIGELPLLMQAKLLRTLQERKIRRVGGREEIPVNVRVVAATARDLEAMIREKRFREDLYYRINVVRIELPPLRARGDDIGLLAERFAARFSREMGKGIVGVTPESYQVLKQYPWPGNVREMQNVIRRAIALSRDSMIGIDDLPDDVVTAAGDRKAAAADQGFFTLRDEHVARFERDYLTNLLTRHHGDVKTAALEARLPRGTLYRLMKNHGLEGAEFR